VKVLVTGSRTWTNRAAIRRELEKLPPGTIVVHGGARRGADQIADEIARILGFEVRVYPVSSQDWSEMGLAAGPIRNSKMLTKEHPDSEGKIIDCGLAFTLDLSKSKGTRDMVRKARAAFIPMDVFSI
jgi:hypothetical protein